MPQLRKHDEFSRYFNYDVRASINYLHENSAELENVIKYFKMYEEPIICFQSSKPLLHAVWPFVLQMKVRLIPRLHMALNFKDKFERISHSGELILSSLCKSALLVLNLKIGEGLITKYHKMATFLHPKKGILRG